MSEPVTEARKALLDIHRNPNGDWHYVTLEDLTERILAIEQPWRESLERLVDDEPCRFDHHGGCQTHGFLDLEPGELCGMEQAQRLLAGESHD